MKIIVTLILLPIHIPHLIAFLFSNKQNIIIKDLERFLRKSSWKLFDFLYYLTFVDEFRALFYFRIGRIKYIIKWFHPEFLNLYFFTPEIGEGLIIQHGFSTVIAAKSIGKNCWINQQVTIGYTNEKDCPVIGDNVTINAGVIIIGNITVGDNVIIGAGTVVTKSIPSNCTVVGNPARIIKWNEKRTNELL